MDTLIVGAAPEPGGDAHYRAILAAAPFVIAADAAAEWAVSLGRTPDVAVGDFDSAETGAPGRLAALGVEVLLHPAEKDASDLDLALAEARSRGYRRVTFAGVTSGRLDHTLAALGTMASAADLEADLDEPSLAAWALLGGEAALELRGPSGALVSVFAMGSSAEGVTLTGFRYPLRSATLAEPSSLGLSNELVGGNATVSVAAGRLLVLSPATAVFARSAPEGLGTGRAGIYWKDGRTGGTGPYSRYRPARIARRARCRRADRLRAGHHIGVVRGRRPRRGLGDRLRDAHEGVVRASRPRAPSRDHG